VKFPLKYTGQCPANGQIRADHKTKNKKKIKDLVRNVCFDDENDIT